MAVQVAGAELWSSRDVEQSRAREWARLLAPNERADLVDAPGALSKARTQRYAICGRRPASAHRSSPALHPVAVRAGTRLTLGAGHPASAPALGKAQELARERETRARGERRAAIVHARALHAMPPGRVHAGGSRSRTPGACYSRAFHPKATTAGSDPRLAGAQERPMCPDRSAVLPIPF
jgi:hypothetical protein